MKLFQCFATVIFLLGCLVFSYGSTTLQESLNIGSFNVQIFGQSKMADDKYVLYNGENVTVSWILTSIIKQYDLLFFQEIRDAEGTAILKLMDMLNGGECTTSCTFKLEISERFGRTSSKEQHAFIYKPSSFQFLHNATYNDSLNDLFEREPFALFVNPILQLTGEPLSFPFFLLGDHLAPSLAMEELNALHTVYDVMATTFNVEKAVLLGDFNADCSYLSSSEWEKVTLYTNTSFVWLVNSTVDTTTSATDCAYDRFVLSPGWNSSISVSLQATSSPGQPLQCEGSFSFVNTTVDRFDVTFALTETDAKAVSDHYPIRTVLQLTAVCGSTSTSSSSEESAATAPRPYFHFLLTPLIVALLCLLSSIPPHFTHIH
eukprot:GCRY01004152.1.p1 GENE.GCRY01004152.1~~GCRY01004152.1.p1  ORF type:complete len:375 (-),score=48.27 GCRY01004152.1:165-1289(-)